ncbi:MAG TPA: hypothetical protein VFF73_09960 [Planctomycetota bacterium]|nr:hypothetical protein [Planctomycetota bacterium]
MEREPHVSKPYHVKEGFKTTEFWLAIVVVAVSTVVIGVQLRENGPNATSWVAVASAALTSIGYSRSRSLAKTGR